jgi:hypothetical protein
MYVITEKQRSLQSCVKQQQQQQQRSNKQAFVE